MIKKVEKKRSEQRCCCPWDCLVNKNKGLNLFRWRTLMHSFWRDRTIIWIWFDFPECKTGFNVGAVRERKKSYDCVLCNNLDGKSQDQNHHESWPDEKQFRSSSKVGSIAKFTPTAVNCIVGGCVSMSSGDLSYTYVFYRLTQILWKRSGR